MIISYKYMALQCLSDQRTVIYLTSDQCTRKEKQGKDFYNILTVIDKWLTLPYLFSSC